MKLFQSRNLKTWLSVLSLSLRAEPQRKGLASLVSVVPDLPDLPSVNSSLVVLVLEPFLSIKKSIFNLQSLKLISINIFATLGISEVLESVYYFSTYLFYIKRFYFKNLFVYAFPMFSEHFPLTVDSKAIRGKLHLCYFC